MNKKVKIILHNLGFAALLGLISVPSMLGIHLLAQKMHSEKPSFQSCHWERQEVSTSNSFYQPFAE